MPSRKGVVGAATAGLVILVLGVWGSAGTESDDEGETTRPSAYTTSQSVPKPGTSISTSIPSSETTEALPRGWASGQVVQVVDGDTISVRLEDGDVERVRLIGINSPESGECFASEATRGLERLIAGELVYLESDESDRDQFDRLLRYVWTTSGFHVNALLVENGLAIAREYPPDTARATELGAAQSSARSATQGLWAPDACGAGTPSDVRILHIEYDAPGDDNINLNGEWVEIRNSDSVPIDLSDWTLKDESSSHRYSFPGGFALDPGEVVRVFTGCGNDSLDELYWCSSGSAVWNNAGDTGFLLDSQGSIVHSFAYD